MNATTGVKPAHLPSPVAGSHVNPRLMSQQLVSQNGFANWGACKSMNGSEAEYQMLASEYPNDDLSQTPGRMLSNLRRFNSPSSFNSKSGAYSKAAKPTQGNMAPPKSHDVINAAVTTDLATSSPSRPSSMAAPISDFESQGLIFSQVTSGPSQPNQAPRRTSPMLSSSRFSPSLPMLTQQVNGEIAMEASTSLSEDLDSIFTKQETNFDANQFDPFPSLSNPTSTPFFNISSNPLEKSPKIQQNPSNNTNDNKIQDNFLAPHHDSNISVGCDPVLWLSSPGGWEDNNLNINGDSSLVPSEHAQYDTSKDPLTSLTSDAQSLDVFRVPFLDSPMRDETCRDSSNINSVLPPATSQDQSFSCDLALPVSNSDVGLQFDPNFTQTATSLSQQVAAKLTRALDSPSGDQQSSISPAESGYDSAELGSATNESSIRLGI